MITATPLTGVDEIDGLEVGFANGSHKADGSMLADGGSGADSIDAAVFVAIDNIDGVGA